MHTAENKTVHSAEATNKNTSGEIPFFQPKLTINAPGDEYEQEADRMADHVMRMPINDTPFFKPNPVSISRLQRKCRSCEDEEKVQRKESSSQPVEAISEVSSYIGSLSSKGSPLPESTRSFFEPRFGHDFSGVRIHNDAGAAKSSQSVNALAYTVGNNIVFNQNQYSPESDGGKALLAHELTHVVQQDNYISNHELVQREPVDAGVVDDKYTAQVNCLVRNGLSYGGIRIAGPITDEETVRVNNFCRSKSGYTGPDLVPNEDESRQVIRLEWLDDTTAENLQKTYLQVLESLVRNSKNIGPEQIQILSSAYSVLLKAGRDVNPLQFNTPKVTRRKSVVYVSVSSALVVGSRTFFSGEAVTGAAFLEGAVELLPPVAALALGVATAYAIYRILLYVGKDAPVDPNVADKVKKLIDDLLKIKDEATKPDPDPVPEPKPEPFGDSFAPPLPKPDDKDKRKRKCIYPTGLSPEEAIPIKWFKPRIDYYYPRHIEIMDSGGLYRDDPDTKLPDGTPVGVKSEFWPHPGKIVSLIPEKRGGKEKDYKKVLEKYDYNWKTEKTSPDHIQDLQWDGPDDFGNFWPMDVTANRSTGPTQNQHQKVTFCETEKGPLWQNKSIQWVKDNGTAIQAFGRFFIIDTIQITPD